MKTRGWKIENGGCQTRSVSECGSPLPLLNHGQCVAIPQSARGLAQFKICRQVVVALFCFFVLPSAFSLRVSGQSYSIDWYKIAGGGGTSTGGVYAVSGSIGQHDAGGPMTGGNYSLTGGFWALVSVIQTPGLPNLIITHAGNSVVVSWPDPATNSYTLQQNGNLSHSGGWATTAYSINWANGTNSITITPPAGNSFFRLKQ